MTHNGIGKIYFEMISFHETEDKRNENPHKVRRYFSVEIYRENKMKKYQKYIFIDGRRMKNKNESKYEQAHRDEAKWKWKERAFRRKNFCVAVKSNLKKTDYIIPFS